MTVFAVSAGATTAGLVSGVGVWDVADQVTSAMVGVVVVATFASATSASQLNLSGSLFPNRSR